MSQPPSDHNASLLWALWHNIDPSELIQQSTELERADTLSVRSEVPNKYTPSYAFPLRKPQYPETTRLKAMQNEVRTRYCSDVPQSARLDNSQQLEVLAKSSTCRYTMVCCVHERYIVVVEGHIIKYQLYVTRPQYIAVKILSSEGSFTEKYQS